MTFEDYLLKAIESIGNARNQACRDLSISKVDDFLRSAETCLWQARQIEQDLKTPKVGHA